VFVAPTAFFGSRGEQFVTLAAREKIPAAYADCEIVETGGLMNYLCCRQFSLRRRLLRPAEAGATKWFIAKIIAAGYDPRGASRARCAGSRR
jgi:hypothetical protein